MSGLFYMNSLHSIAAILWIIRDAETSLCLKVAYVTVVMFLFLIP